MKEELEKLYKQARKEISEAEDAQQLESARIKYLGRKGSLTSLLRSTKDLPPDQRPSFGKRANEVKAELEAVFNDRKKDLASTDHFNVSSYKKVKSGQSDLSASISVNLDVTLPGFRPGRGGIHPVNRMLNEMVRVFEGMGYSVASGPEVELDEYNFTRLNFPPDHPARDMQDTFFVSDDVVLRTHTSPVQIRAMESAKPPFRIVSPGKVYRHDRDPSHSPMFFQLEGFVVDKRISMADLKGALTAFAREIFDEDTPVRFRPSFFPFTEPSAEMDIGCIFCDNRGCRMCKYTGWIEILGSGMIHPQVLRNVGADPFEWTGFAFGMGVERIAILKYGIEPISTFFENDLRFLRQF